MKIQILGTRGEITASLRRYSKHSGILIDAEILMDLGEKQFLKKDPKWILITHFHPDHAYFVRHGHEEIPLTKAPIFGPEKLLNEEFKDLVTILDKRKKFGSYTIIPIPIHHSKHVKSQAYVIKKGKHSLLYTGDIVWIDKQYHSLIGKVDLVITEGSYLRKGGLVRKDKETNRLYGHNGIPNLINLFKNFTNVIVFTHFGSWFYKNPHQARKKIELLGKENNLRAIAAYDGMVIEI